jgi:hypothetical protein
MIAGARALGYPDRGHAAKLLDPPRRREALAAIADGRA